MKITILMDNPNSWILPHGEQLRDVLVHDGHEVSIERNAEDIRESDITFCLGCEKIVSSEVRTRSTHTLVVHESALPLGKGWSPLTWQILEGQNEIPVTLFEAADAVDSGDIYGQKIIQFDGTELVDELRKKQGEATVELALDFVRAYPHVTARAQSGEESFYPRRRPQDSELDPSKSLAELFNQLRVADNDRYPAFFSHKGKTYILKIFHKQ